MLICRESDVRALHRLQAIEGGRWAYLIETPFMAFPRWVVGTTDARNDDVRIVLTCGLQVTAEAEFVRRWGSVAERAALKEGEP